MANTPNANSKPLQRRLVDKKKWQNEIRKCLAPFAIIVTLALAYVIINERNNFIEVGIWWSAYLASAFVVPGFVVAYLAYPAKERVRRAETMIRDIIGKKSSERRQRAEEYFNIKQTDSLRYQVLGLYNPRNYLNPIFFLLMVNAIGFFLVFSSNLPLIPLGEIDDLVLGIPQSAFFGFVGGWFYALYSVLTRYRSSDISSSLVFQLSYQITISAALGYFISEFTEANGSNFLAFAAGFVPYSNLVTWIRGKAQTRLGIQSEFESTSDAKSHLAKQSLLTLQGISRAELERLSEEGITTIQHLAHTNPLRIYFVTSFPISQIIDWIDQAYLRMYLDEKTTKYLACHGIRGGIGFSQLNDAIFELEGSEKEALREEIRNVMGIKEQSLNYLISQLEYDPQILLLSALWELYGGS